MLKSIYLYLWMLAFHSYVVLLISFLVANKNRLVNNVTALVAVGAVWVTASLALRLGVGPTPIFWFSLSEISLMLIPYMMYFSLLAAAGRKVTMKVRLPMIILAVVEVSIALLDGYFNPEFIQVVSDTDKAFRVDNLVDVILNPKPLAIIYVICTTILCLLILKVLHDNERIEYRTLLIFGLCSYWLLTLLYIYQKSSFPYELVAGIFNGMIFLYLLRNRRILNFNIHIKHGIFPFFATFTVILFMGLMNWRPWGRLAPVKNSVLNVVLITTCITSLVTLMFEFLYAKFFFDRGDYILKCNSHYHDELLPKLGNIDDIADLFSKMMRTTYGSTNLALYILDERTKCYILRGKSLCQKKSFTSEDPIVEHSMYLNGPQSAWNILQYLDEEDSQDLTKAIEDRELSIFSPLKVNDTLLGFFLFGGDRVRSLDRIDHDSISSISKTTAMAIDATFMMHTLAHDAVTDQLTGLCDRTTAKKYIDHLLSCGGSFIFMLFNLDNLKLFNQVYGFAEGDRLLCEFADTLTDNAPEGAILSRISGKTFGAYVMASREVAIEFDTKVRENFKSRNKGTIRAEMSFCTGLVDVLENDGRSSNELLNQVKLAEIIAKKNGKDQLCIYEEDMKKDPEMLDTGFEIRAVDAISKALDLRDHFTYNHSDNVAMYARAIAEAAGLSRLDCQIVYEAGLVHDIGKISIPDAVLLNPGKLTDEEYEIMKSHVERGREVIESLPHGFLMVPMAMSHHERWDGRGYPKGLKGKEIPIGGRCLAIADTFDAMTSKRVYRKAFSVEEALEEIERVSGTQLDPVLGPLFVKLVRSGKIKPAPAL